MKPERQRARGAAKLAAVFALYGSPSWAAPDAGPAPSSQSPPEQPPPAPQQPAPGPSGSAPGQPPPDDTQPPAQHRAERPPRPATAPAPAQRPAPTGVVPAAPSPSPPPQRPPPPAHGYPPSPAQPSRATLPAGGAALGPAGPAPRGAGQQRPYPPAAGGAPPGGADGGAAAVPPERRNAFALDVSAGMIGAARFPSTARDSKAQEIVGAVLEAGVWLDLKRKLAFGLSYERADLGQARFAITPRGESLDAVYGVDTFWLRGRWYATRERPALYLDVAAGPALGRARATGTRASATFTEPARSFRCSDYGSLGVGGRLAAGVELDLLDSLSFTVQAAVAGHYLSGADGAFGGCAPGVGPAVNGGARLGLSYRFGS